MYLIILSSVSVLGWFWLFFTLVICHIFFLLSFLVIFNVIFCEFYLVGCYILLYFYKPWTLLLGKIWFGGRWLLILRGVRLTEAVLRLGLIIPWYKCKTLLNALCLVEKLLFSALWQREVLVLLILLDIFLSSLGTYHYSAEWMSEGCRSLGLSIHLSPLCHSVTLACLSPWVLCCFSST